MHWRRNNMNSAPLPWAGGGPTRRARKVHPTAAQSLLLLLPSSLPLLLLIVRVSTRRNIDFTMKFADNDDGGGVKRNGKSLLLGGGARVSRTHKHNAVVLYQMYSIKTPAQTRR